MSGKRYSDFFVTVNTHRPWTEDNIAAVYRAIDGLDTEIRGADATATVRTVIALGDDDVLHSAATSAVGLERMSYQRGFKLHVHFVWEIVHSTEIHVGPRGSSDGKGLNRRLQEYFAREIGVDGVYCRASILLERSRAKNYTSKKGQNVTLAARSVRNFDTTRRASSVPPRR